MLECWHLEDKKFMEQLFLSILKDKKVDAVQFKDVSGYQDKTYLVNDEWIIKLPISQEDYYKFDDQRDLMAIVKPRMTTVQIPEYEARAFELEHPNGYGQTIHAARYKKIDGVVLEDLQKNGNLTDEKKKQIMSELAQVFHDLHSVPLEEIYVFFPDSPLHKIEKCIKEARPDFYDLKKRERDLLIKDITRSVYPAYHFKFCHNDLHAGNICVDPKSAHITGILDFGSAGIGFVENDVSSYSHNETEKDEVVMLKKQYESLSKKTLNAEDKKIIKTLDMDAWELFPQVQHALKMRRGR